MIQQNLFSVTAPAADPAGLARHTDPGTSKAAARDFSSIGVAAAVLRAVREAAMGLTIEECAGITGLSLVTVSPRFRPLANRGLIRDSGRRRRNHSGKLAIVWTAI
jgi:hypothetical protein